MPTFLLAGVYKASKPMISRSLFFQEGQDGADQSKINENYAKPPFSRVTLMKGEGKHRLSSPGGQSKENCQNGFDIYLDCENYANQYVTGKDT